MLDRTLHLDHVPLSYSLHLSLSLTQTHTQINQALVKVDEVIKEFTDGLKGKEIFDCVNFIIVSDHGELLIVMT